MNGTKLESVQYMQDLGVTLQSSLKFSQQCRDAAGKANRMLGFINEIISLKIKDVILPLYTSLVRPYLEYAVRFGAPYHAKDMAKLEAIQLRATEMITSLRNKPYDTRRGWYDLTCSLSRSEGWEEKLLSVLISSKDLRTCTLARCSRLITHHKQGVTG